MDECAAGNGVIVKCNMEKESQSCWIFGRKGGDGQKLKEGGILRYFEMMLCKGTRYG